MVATRTEMSNLGSARRAVVVLPLGVPATKIRATVLRVVLAAAVPHLGPGTETAVTRLSRTATMARATALLQEQVHQEALRLGTSLLPRPQARLAATRAMADMVVPMVAPLV